jgi:hypothetical protein
LRTTYQRGATNDGIGFFGGLIILTIIVIVVAGVWRVYENAGYPG